MSSLLFGLKIFCWTMLGLALVFWAYRGEEVTEAILEFMLPFSVGLLTGFIRRFRGSEL